MKDGIVSMQGLIAQGRGEAFDYLLGEKTTGSAMEAERAAVAMMLLAKRPVISVNGNAAALAAGELCALSLVLNAPLEVNLFHRTEERVARVIALLMSNGAVTVYGDRPDKLIPGLSHERAKATSEGIYGADVVLVPLEDGDRCEALLKMNKTVIAIDLNPLSRTAQTATVTIVDNIVRAVPYMVEMAKDMKALDSVGLERIVNAYDNRRALTQALRYMADNVKKAQ